MIGQQRRQTLPEQEVVLGEQDVQRRHPFMLGIALGRCGRIEKPFERSAQVAGHRPVIGDRPGPLVATAGHRRR